MSCPLSLASVLWAPLLGTSGLLHEWAVGLLNRSSLLLSWCWRIPVIDHLDSEHKVEDEASYESVEDERIIHLLDGCENAGKRSGKVVEDLFYSSAHAWVSIGACR